MDKDKLEEMVKAVKDGTIPSFMLLGYSKKGVKLPKIEAFGLVFNDGDVHPVEMRYENAINEGMQEIGFHINDIHLTAEDKKFRVERDKKMKEMLDPKINRKLPQPEKEDKK